MDGKKTAKVVYLSLTFIALVCFIIHIIFGIEWMLKVVGVYILLSLIGATIKPRYFVDMLNHK